MKLSLWEIFKYFYQISINLLLGISANSEILYVHEDLKSQELINYGQKLWELVKHAQTYETYQTLPTNYATTNLSGCRQQRGLGFNLSKAWLHRSQVYAWNYSVVPDAFNCWFTARKKTGTTFN